MINKEYERFIGRLDRQKFEEEYPRCACSICKKRRGTMIKMSEFIGKIKP